MKTPRLELLIGLLVCATLAGIGCGKTDARRVEKAIAETTTPQSRTDPDASTTLLPPPTADDVRQAVLRIFGGNVVAEPEAPLWYLTGDFNGDDSPDLAVEVRPARNRLSTLNEGLANWIVEDPREVFVPDARKGKVQKLPPKASQQRVRAGERLLAIVHGYGPQGWREAMAQQTYLLRNADGRELALKRKEEILAGNTMARPLFGDLIERRSGGGKSLLFWTGGHYAWYEGQ